METPSIGTKALLKGSWWDDDAQTDEERADRERYWVVEVVREDKNYVQQGSTRTIHAFFFKTIKSDDGKIAPLEDEETIKGQVLTLRGLQKAAKEYEEWSSRVAAMKAADELVERVTADEEDSGDEDFRAPAQSWEVTLPKKRTAAATFKIVTAATFFAKHGQRIVDPQIKSDKHEFRCLLCGEDQPTLITEFASRGKEFTQTGKRARHLRDNHSEVYEKYIEPHASKKRYNSDDKIVQLYGVREALDKHVSFAVAVCEDKRALSFAATDAFGSFLTKLDERYVPPEKKTLRRLIFALRDVIKGKFREELDEMRESRGSPFLAGSLDFWSKGGASFGGICAHYVSSKPRTKERIKRERARHTISADEDISKAIARLRQEASAGDAVLEEPLTKRTVVLSFKLFEERHSAHNIKDWINEQHADLGLQPRDFDMYVPDAASNGLLGLELVGVSTRICWPHRLERCHHYAVKAAASTIGVFLRKVRRLSLRVHTSNILTDALLDAQKDEPGRGVPATTLTGSATRQWGGDTKMVRRVNGLGVALSRALLGDRDAAKPSEDEIGEISDMVQNKQLGAYSDDEGGAEELVKRLETAQDEEDDEPVLLPLDESEDAKPDALAKAPSRSFILTSRDRTMGLFFEAVTYPIELLTTKVEGVKDGTSAITEGDVGFLNLSLLAKQLKADTIEVPSATNRSLQAIERFIDAENVPKEQYGSSVATRETCGTRRVVLTCSCPHRWPEGVETYRSTFVDQMLCRWGDGENLVPDQWTLAELAFNPLFVHLKSLPNMTSELAEKAEDLLLAFFEDAANHLNDVANGGDEDSPMPLHLRRRSSSSRGPLVRGTTSTVGTTSTAGTTSTTTVTLGDLGGLCDGFDDVDTAADAAVKKGPYNAEDALTQWRNTPKSLLRPYASFDEKGRANALDLLRYFSKKSNRDAQPVAYTVCLRLKCGVLTEAAVERLFSFASGTLSDLRTRLSPKYLEAIVFVGQNASQFDFTMEEVWAAFLKIKEDELVAVGDA